MTDEEIPEEIPEELDKFLGKRKRVEPEDVVDDLDALLNNPIIRTESYTRLDEPLDEVQSVQDYTNSQLVHRYLQVKQELFRLREAMATKTQEGRDLHSERTALLVELRRRKLR